MSKYRITNEKFINPYNFVSIDDSVQRDTVSYGTLSGVISCELETLTPLFIPNTSKDNTFGDTYSHSYDFFSYEDLTKRGDYKDNPARPIIPGSSIRGCLRSAFEAALNGCMSSCDDENTLYRRTPVPRKFYGIIEKLGSERVLYEASKSQSGDDNWPIGKRGSHKTGEDLFGDGGVYLRGEDFPFGKTAKKYDAIMRYELDANGDKIEVARFSEDSREWANFVEVWRLYQNKQGEIKGVNQTGTHSGYKGYLNSEPLPVYYTQLENVGFYYLAPAAITKEVFSRTLAELLERQGGHNPCADGKNLCAACALFGMVGDESRASRLFFKDAAPAEDADNWRDFYDSVRVLPILSSPKVSATEFYMEDVPGSAYFNYDYSVNYYNGGTRQYEAVRTFLENPKLRGRKLYWHRKTPLLDKSTLFPAQRTEIRPVKSGKTFKFDIAFDRLTEEELKHLVWVLTFGDKNLTHAHKLGHGKPVGYGSVRITKAEVKTISLGDDFSLSENAAQITPKTPESTDTLKEYLAMTDFSSASDLVKYPIGEKGKIYEWFEINKQIQKGAFNPSFNYALPKPLPLKDIALPKYESGDGEIGGNRKHIELAKNSEGSASNAHKAVGKHISEPAAKPSSVKPEDLDALKETMAEEKKKQKHDEDFAKAMAKAEYTLKIFNKCDQKQKKELEKFVATYGAESKCAELCVKIKRKLGD
ncbi:hypothetical protein FACS1894187_13640 [Synergistales bacterium]|nr:hypothetical protein FACS1894187_13640 [Synergistales bacterium]